MNFSHSKYKNPDFQKEITFFEMQTIIDRAFQKKFSIESCVEMKAGLFNSTYKVTLTGEETVVLRVAPAISAEIYNHERYLLRREYFINTFLSSIAEYTPKIIFADFTKQLIDRDYTILNFIDGNNWGDLIEKLSDKQHRELWHKIDVISKKITGVTGNFFGMPFPAMQFPSWSSALIDILNGMIKDLEKYGFASDHSKKHLSLLTKHRKYLDHIDKPSLVHGDLWHRNILLRNEYDPQIVGVLDSERAYWGDPKAEWIIVGKNFARQTAGKGNVFKCGLFAADFGEIPDSLAKLHKVENKNDMIRNDLYLGIYLTQRLLEAQRFPREELWIHEEFKKVFMRLINREENSHE